MSRAGRPLPAPLFDSLETKPTPVSDWPVRFSCSKRTRSARGARGFSIFCFTSAVDPRASDRPRRHCASRDERRGAPPRRGRGARGWRARARARAPVHADGLGQGTSRALGERACRREPAHLSVRRLPFWHLPAPSGSSSRSSPRRRPRPRATLARHRRRPTDDAPTLTVSSHLTSTPAPRAAPTTAGVHAPGPRATPGSLFG